MYFSNIDHPAKLWKDPRLAFDFYCKSSLRLAGISLFKKKKQKGKINGRKILSMEEANAAIYNGLSGDKPFVVGRSGGTESRYVLWREFVEAGAVDAFSEEFMQNGKNKSGIFPPTQENSMRFALKYSEAMGKADLSVFWGHILCEDFLFKKFAKNSTLIPSRSLEPFGFDIPWTKALENKKVLVIHPFAELIERQYKNRDKLFENESILPEFELLTVKAVQTLADQDSSFSDWFSAFEYMKSRILEKEFDIAILGCGAYAQPLAAHIKDLGKKAVVLGGFTQILFGIKGSRWEKSRHDIVSMYNDFWTRPDEEYRPSGSEKVEENAYW